MAIKYKIVSKPHKRFGKVYDIVSFKSVGGVQVSVNKIVNSFFVDKKQAEIELEKLRNG